MGDGPGFWQTRGDSRSVIGPACNSNGSTQATQAVAHGFQPEMPRGGIWRHVGIKPQTIVHNQEVKINFGVIERNLHL